MTVCIQCAMRAMLAGLPAPTFTETPEEHARRVHPDLAATRAERHEMERRLAEDMRGLVPLHVAVNRADRLCAETGRTHYVIGNGLGQYSVVDRLPTLPAGIPAGAAGAGTQTVRPEYMAAPPQRTTTNE